MKVLMVHAPMKEEHVADTEAAIEKLIAALKEAAPEGIHYAAGKLADGVTFVALLQLDDEGNHPLVDFPAYQELTESLGAWRSAPATAEQITVLGSYGLFD